MWAAARYCAKGAENLEKVTTSKTHSPIMLVKMIANL